MDLPPSAEKDKVKIMANDKLTFLDMKMIWSYNGDLEFLVYRKKRQQFKYIGKWSTHTTGTLHAIPSGVLNCLEKITSRKTIFQSEMVDNVYLDHVNNIRKAGLAPPISPTMGE